MTDPIADFLTRVRNASRAELPEVKVPHSKMKESIARIMKQEGYLVDCAVEEEPKKTLRLKLKFTGRRGVIEGMRRVSRPGIRWYVGAKKIPRVLGGLGIAVVSTPQGVMSDKEARKKNIGGELICYIW